MPDYLFDPPAIVAPAEDVAALAALAAEINADHEAGEELTRRGLEHYRACGEKLLRAKARCGHGRWLKWAKANLRFSERKAQRYMELARCDVTSDLAEEWRRISGNSTAGEGDAEPTSTPAQPEASTGTEAGADAPDIKDGDGGAALPHVAHATGNPEWYTPIEILDAARTVLGEFDLDPASSDRAQVNVRATTYYTKEHDGLSKPWAGRVWMNPPYAKDVVNLFTEKLASHHESGDVTAAIVLVNNATETQWFSRLAAVASAICYPTGRVRFLEPDGTPGRPLQGQAVLYLGDTADSFMREFNRFGFCAEVRQEGSLGSQPIGRESDASAETNWEDKECKIVEWYTPPAIVERVRDYFGGPIPLDPATAPHNPTGALRFFTAELDGLAQDWSGVGAFVNPPYGKVMSDWCRKVHEETAKGLPLIALLPCGARFSTAYWQDYILTGQLTAICFVRGRVAFVGPDGEEQQGNPYDSAVYGFNTDCERFARAFGPLGRCVRCEPLPAAGPARRDPGAFGGVVP
jgi:ParB family chromosome partitioning protein